MRKFTLHPPPPNKVCFLQMAKLILKYVHLDIDFKLVSVWHLLGYRCWVVKHSLLLVTFSKDICQDCWNLINKALSVIYVPKYFAVFPYNSLVLFM